MRAGAAAGFFGGNPCFFTYILFYRTPVLELMLLIELGRAIGTWPPILLVLGTGGSRGIFRKNAGFIPFPTDPGGTPARQYAGPGDDQRALRSPGGILLLTPPVCSRISPA